MDYKAQHTSSSSAKIDTHHHYVPEFWRKAGEEAGLPPWAAPPPWTPELAQQTMKELGVTTTILSMVSPGRELHGPPSREDARAINKYGAGLRDAHPGKFGFFATLPSLLDVEGVLAEIPHALDEMKAEGVIMMARYGQEENCYLGDPRLRPMWAELNRRKAVVFVHPVPPLLGKAPFPKTILPNITEFTQETTRTAVDMIYSNTKRDFPDCKVILSHAGGHLPYLIGRISLIDVLPYTGIDKTHDEVLAEAKSFYYDLALSGHESVLAALFKFVPEDHIVFGSDSPYIPKPGMWRMNDLWESYDLTQEVRDKINFKNAQAILPMFKDKTIK